MSEIPAGAMRFNSDSQKLEYWNGSAWFQVHTATPNLGDAGDRQPGARGAWAGGNANTPIHGDIEYVNITSTGNSVDFGADITSRRRASAFASSTRMVVNGGATPTSTGVQEFFTFSSTGTVTAWGDTLSTTGSCDNAAFGNQTRGITKSGYASPGATGTMDYCTIASEGNTQDFGDLIANGDAPGGFSNSTRGILGGGYEPANDNTITFVTISTLGNAQDFGDLTLGRYSIAGGVSNKTRGLFGGGYTRSPAPAANQDVIDYVTISSGGNAMNFGDLLETRGTASGVSNCIRGVYGGGYTSPTNRIQYVQIATEGDSVDFGDLSVRSGGKGAAASNAHGGL